MDGWRIELRNGPDSRTAIQPLFARVYPEPVLREVSWRNVMSASADERLVVSDATGVIVVAAGLVFRTGRLLDHAVRIGGIGGVMVAPERQRQGLGRSIMIAAHDVLRSRSKLQFGLLFCESHNLSFYRGIGWQAFDGRIRIEQPSGPVEDYAVMSALTIDLAGTAPRSGPLDLCGLPW